MSTRPHRRESEPLIDLAVPQRCHIVGIGGPGMSPIAKLLASRGHIVTGSDTRSTSVTDQLGELGIAISHDHSASLVDDATVVTYSTAIPASNVEVRAARERGIPVRHRSGLLAALCAQSRAVGVAGTHGKTTSTALLAVMLEAGGVDPSVIVGAEVAGYGVGARAGHSDVLVLEADESDGTLDVLPLHSVLITNVDIDHLDYFGSFDEVRQCFADAAQRAGGAVVLNLDDENSAQARQSVSEGTILLTFGRSVDADVRVVSAISTSTGTDVELQNAGSSFRCQLPLRGAHNAMNLAGAVAMAMTLGVDIDVSCRAAEKFRGVARRFTERGSFRGAQLIDDYAHLPAEIEAALDAARSHPALSGKVVAVFQPNRFHRIAAMADSYADCFERADVVVITDIYASGTERIEGVTGKMVSDAIAQKHPNAQVVWAPTRSDIVSFLQSSLTVGDVCLSMGCGDIEFLPDELMGAR